MAGERLSMRKIKKVLRLTFENHISARQIAKSCDKRTVLIDGYGFQGTVPAEDRKVPEGARINTGRFRLRNAAAITFPSIPQATSHSFPSHPGSPLRIASNYSFFLKNRARRLF